MYLSVILFLSPHAFALLAYAPSLSSFPLSFIAISHCFISLSLPLFLLFFRRMGHFNAADCDEEEEGEEKDKSGRRRGQLIPTIQDRGFRRQKLSRGCPMVDLHLVKDRLRNFLFGTFCADLLKDILNKAPF